MEDVQSSRTPAILWITFSILVVLAMGTFAAWQVTLSTADEHSSNKVEEEVVSIPDAPNVAQPPLPPTASTPEPEPLRSIPSWPPAEKSIRQPEPIEPAPSIETREWQTSRSNDVSNTAHSRANLPETLWRPSTRATISWKHFSKAKTLSDADEILIDALEQAGYIERGYYLLHDGFAIATRLEQIDADGTPKKGINRWTRKIDRHTDLSPSGLIQLLFTAPEGHYRVVLFAITEVPIRTGSSTLTDIEAETLILDGADRLPPQIAKYLVGDQTRCTALVYQFLKSGQEQPVRLMFSGIQPGASQLQRSGFKLAFRKTGA